MRRTRTAFYCHLIVTLLPLTRPSSSEAADVQPPNGFVALFNGKDLAGWHGRPHFDPYKLAAIPAEQRQQEIKKWTEDAAKHCPD